MPVQRLLPTVIKQANTHNIKRRKKINGVEIRHEWITNAAAIKCLVYAKICSVSTIVLTLRTCQKCLHMRCCNMAAMSSGNRVTITAQWKWIQCIIVMEFGPRCIDLKCDTIESIRLLCYCDSQSICLDYLRCAFIIVSDHTIADISILFQLFFFFFYFWPQQRNYK